MLTLVVKTALAGAATLTTAQAEAPAVRLNVLTGVSRYLSPEDPFASFIVEPVLRVPVVPRTLFQAGTRIERPFDSHEDFRAPRAWVSLTHAPELVPGWATQAWYRLSALDLDRWSTDGYVLRNWLGLEASKAVAPWLTLRLVLAPWLQLHRYAQRTSGAEIPGGGIQERVHLTAAAGRWSLDLSVMLEQSRASAWRNEYTTFERLRFLAADWVAVGVSHELVTSVVDDSTGAAGAFRLTGRESLVTAFAEWRL